MKNLELVFFLTSITFALDGSLFIINASAADRTLEAHPWGGTILRVARDGGEPEFLAGGFCEHVGRRDQMHLAGPVRRQQRKYLQCHSQFRNAEYQLHVTTLCGLGLSAEDLRLTILEPSQVVPPSYCDVVATLVDGWTVRGPLIARDQQEVVVQARAAQQAINRRTLPMADIDTEEGKRRIEQSNMARMSTDFGKTPSPKKWMRSRV